MPEQGSQRSELEQACERIAVLEAEQKTTYCAYCGAEFPLDATTLVAVGEHITTCEKHPMSWLRQRVEQHLLPALQLVYRKHVLADERIGWEELDNTVMHALCEAMGDEGFQQWLREVRREA